MAVPAGGRSGLLHGVTGSAHAMGNVLAKLRNLSDGFPVALLAVAFQIFLVRPVWKCDAVFEIENFGSIVCKRGYCYEKNYRN
jgi:hypothetical protein